MSDEPERPPGEAERGAAERLLSQAAEARRGAAVTDLFGRHLHFDCQSGCAGDMVLGALLDLGVPEAAVRDALAKLPVGGYTLEVRKAKRGGLVGTDVRVLVEHEHEHEHHGHDHEHRHAHRHYRDIRAMLAALPAAVRDLAVAIFDRIADAEARLHGVPVDEVAFHEVGAIDSIVDVVGAAAALAWLQPASVSATPVATGRGTVGTAHGRLPVPAPATVEIVRAGGVPITDGGSDVELLTPTGAAILAGVVRAFGAAPPMRVLAAGYGAGDRELPDRPNLLRAVLGDPLTVAAEQSLCELHANLDDMNPELCEHVTERLFAAGALDVWWTPVTMKKSRPAVVLGVLAPAAREPELASVILAETTTLGVRRAPVARRALDRRIDTVETPYGEVAVKVATEAGRIVNVAPEYESCRRVAAARAVPLKEVYAAAVAAWRARPPW